MTDGVARRCPRCTAAAEPGQEYCLECGLRLSSAPAAAATPAGAPPPAARGWLGPAFLALVVAAAGAAAAVALSSDSQASESIVVATGGNLTVTETSTLPTAPEPTPTTKTTRTAPATTRPRPTVSAFATWPRPRRGWTIVLLSLPQTGGRDAADAKADEARKGGLRRVGVLNSNRYASLHPGYYVIFTGIFETETEAVSALQRARAVFRSAYQREIVP